MMVKPDEISASNAPSTSPLKHCDMKLPQLITRFPRAERYCFVLVLTSISDASAFPVTDAMERRALRATLAVQA
jgi:hypothetical protein